MRNPADMAKSDFINQAQVSLLKAQLFHRRASIPLLSWGEEAKPLNLGPLQPYTPGTLLNWNIEELRKTMQTFETTQKKQYSLFL